ncbi:MAG: DUF6076 domain-containing protein [Oscillospiraceae bacterium]|nr:DUF6076 domain-containing protein [Oscillospiraceae bacterium]
MGPIHLLINLHENNIFMIWFGLVYETKKDIKMLETGMKLQDLHNLKGKFKLFSTSRNYSIEKLLIDFVSWDFDDSDEAFIFFNQFYGGINIKGLSSPTDSTYEGVRELSNQYYAKNKDKTKQIQADFRMAIDFVYNINSDERLDGLTLKQRLYIFEYYYHKLSIYCDIIESNSGLSFNYEGDFEEKGTNDLDYLINYIKEYDPNGKKLTTGRFFFTNNIWTVYYILLYHLVFIENQTIKKCKNCGRYFATTKSNSQYCDRIISEGKTCKEIGTMLSQKNKEQEEPVYGLYRQIYAKKAMLVKRNPDIASYKYEYEEWKEDAQRFIKDIKVGTKTYDDFAEWLGKNN